MTAWDTFSLVAASIGLVFVIILAIVAVAMLVGHLTSDTTAHDPKADDRE